MHQVADFGQALAQLAAGMQFGEVLGLEAFAQADGDGKGIAQGQHGGGGGGGGEVQSAGFALYAAVEGYVARRSQG